MIAIGMALALAGCGATPKDGEVMADGVRLQPVALRTDADPAQCAAHAVLMHRAAVAADWSASVSTPATLHVPRDVRVVEMICTADTDGRRSTRFLTSQESEEARSGKAATGAMFLLLGGLPALATGAMQRTDVYEFPAAVSVALPPPRAAAAADSAGYAARRTAEIDSETAAWRAVRHVLCDNERDRGIEVMSPGCEKALAAIDQRRKELLIEAKGQQTASND